MEIGKFNKRISNPDGYNDYCRKCWRKMVLEGLQMKLIKLILNYLLEALKESIAQIFTLLGFFIAWLTLTGSAQQVVGVATLIATVIWLATIPIRKD